MKNNNIFSMLLLLIALACPATYATQVNNLYQAVVDSAVTTQQWQQQALLQVLRRVSGRADVDSLGTVATEIKQAAGYIKQFEAVRRDGKDQMRVLLDAQKVNQLLQQNSIAVWGALRPDVLVWLVQQNGAERQFLRNPQLQTVASLKTAFDDAGLPLTLPLYDMDDLLVISETDVWAGFWQQINQASGRYPTDVVIAVTLDQTIQDNKSLYRLTWQRQDNGRALRDEITSEDASELIPAFAAALAGQLAQRYASILSQGELTKAVLDVEALTSLTDLVQVQQLLQRLVGVSKVTIGAYQNGVARFELLCSIGESDLINALQFNRQLQRQQRDNTALSDTPALADTSALPGTATESAIAVFRYVNH